MELDITQFFNEAAPMDYSASVAEIGNNAGADTWRAATEAVDDYPLLDTDEKRDAFRAFVRSSGGWTAEEIAAWDNTALNALCIQWIAGDMRECPDVEMGPNMTDADWLTVEAMQENGTISGRIGKGGDNRIYFSLDA